MKKSKDSWKFVYILARIEIDKEKRTWILILSQYKFKFGNYIPKVHILSKNS